MSRASLTEESTSRFVETPRWRIHYNEAGRGHPLIMLHGSGPGATGWSNFSGNLMALAARYRVILPDLPGWGRSDELEVTEEPRPAALVEAVRMLLDALGIERAALMGNSMGGGITYSFAASYPDRVSHIVTMGAGLFGGIPLGFAPAGPSEGLQILARTYEDPSPENFRRLCNVMLFDPAYATEELVEQRALAAQANPRHLENWVKAARAGKAMQTPPAAFEVASKLSKVSIPALLFHGRDDRIVGIEATLRAASILQNSQMLVINRCGHWAQLEQAATFNAFVDRFLEMPWGSDPVAGRH